MQAGKQLKLIAKQISFLYTGGTTLIPKLMAVYIYFFYKTEQVKAYKQHLHATILRGAQERRIPGKFGAEASVR